MKQEHIDRLVYVGRGRPAGELFRRYWQPALLSSEVPHNDGAPVRVRLLGEDLIAFRDSKGRVGLVDAFCPHRRAPLFFGRNEECGMRCVYHGWKFDVTAAASTCRPSRRKHPQGSHSHRGLSVRRARRRHLGLSSGRPTSMPAPPDYRVAARARDASRRQQELAGKQLFAGLRRRSRYRACHLPA